MPRVKKTIKIVDIENTVENIENTVETIEIPVEKIEQLPTILETSVVIIEQSPTILETPVEKIEQSPTILETPVEPIIPESKSKDSTKIKCVDCGKMILAKTLKYSHLYTCRSKKKDIIEVLPEALPKVSVQEPSVVQQPVLQEPPVVQEPVSVAYPPPQFIRRVSNLDRNRSKHVDKINKLALNIA